ncbi:MAG: ferritin-like domain-containing protein [Rhodospirillales bacterium]|nr:ferritin-like domain-containing protein [Rhodospirillales bacterium]
MSSTALTIPPTGIVNDRRNFLAGVGKATLSATAVALIVGCESLAQGSGTMSDVNILNTALGLEHEGIMAYQIGAESGLLQPEVLKVAVMFQGHHKEHREILAGAIRKLGGTPVAEKPKAEYAAALNVASIKNQADVLRLAARLERGATNAYIGVMPAFADRGLAQVAARLVADESMHWTVLASALGEPLPAKALSFGA